jgi:hypothetical protein
VTRDTNNDFRLPGLTHRTGVFGRTGTGKTRQGAWLLSVSAFDKQPFVVLDYKLEQLFTQADRIKEIGLKEKLPKAPGVYVLRPTSRDDEAVENWLWSVHEKENIGLYVDEGYGIDRFSKAMRAVLTQGRSKRLPVIWLSQRPTQIPPFVVSEADFLSVFQLTLPQDVQKVSEIMGKAEAELSQRLPDYHSRWFDVGRANGFVMKPVPGDEDILNRLDERLSPKRRFY